jgi:ribosomal protein S12 methylthiotransferase
MAVQQEVSREILAKKVGQTIDVLIDEVDEEGAIGRTQWDAPEIDGSVFLNGATELRPGGLLRATVQHADEYDLWARLDFAPAPQG